MNADPSDPPQAGTISDASPGLMPRLGTYKMPGRPKEIVAAHENITTPKILPIENFKGHRDSIVTG